MTMMKEINQDGGGHDEEYIGTKSGGGLLPYVGSKKTSDLNIGRHLS
jgi:hypothetical protein